MKRILVTGGAGYIGSHLVRKLLKKKYIVHVLDNFTYEDNGLKNISKKKNLHIFKGDICNIKDVSAAMQRVDTVMALAAIVGDPACALDEKETYSVNYESTKVLMELCKFYNIKRVIFASSCSVYGASKGEKLLYETSRLNPVSLYAKTRIMSEDVILKTHEKVSPVILRLSTVFGASPRMRFDLVVNFLTAKALKERKIEVFGGDQWRPLIHAQDAAEAFILAGEKNKNIVHRQIFNIGGQNLNYKIEDIGMLVKKEIPKSKLLILQGRGDQRDYRVSFAKAKKKLGFEPKFSVSRGIREIVRAFTNKKIKNYKEKIYYNVDYIYIQ